MHRQTLKEREEMLLGALVIVEENEKEKEEIWYGMVLRLVP